MDRVAEGSVKKGLIWHTQGSGKSLTMVFLALKLKTHLTLDAPRSEPQHPGPDRPHRPGRSDFQDLRGLRPAEPETGVLGRNCARRWRRGGNGQILLSTIFKFAGSKEPIPNSDNWIVLVDECHRTQEKDLGAFF